ncbi:MAG: hypothetical protein IKY64_00890 [Bacteroidaceae bacterium]|nr:hypothetical protein [Bacteroidaceae bacterium]
MKKIFRTLCMGLVAASSLTGFAQTNVTHKLVNADMEMGVMGWDIVFADDNWHVTRHDQSSEPEYHGINSRNIEVWRYNNGPMTDNCVSQTVKNLPNGTYVFGAYLVACSDNEDLIAEKDLIEGVYLFANSDSTSVGTNRPGKKREIWDHSAKFNVATTVTDGTLTVGMFARSTNANYTLMDNATLYYFGEKDAAAALDEMAKIDIARTIAIADTCLAHKMNADSLAYLKEQVEMAKKLTTAAEFYNADELLYWGIRQAVKSIKDYDKLYAALAYANEIASEEWTDFETTVAALAELNALIVANETVYEGGTAERPEVEAAVAALNEAAALVQLDSCYVLIDVYNGILDELEVGDEVGQYSETAKEHFEELLFQVEEYLAEVDEGYLSAAEAKKLCDAIYVQIKHILDNPIAYNEFPIVINRGTQNVSGQEFALLEGMTTDETGRPIYMSPTYRFHEPLTKVRFTVLETGKNQKNGNFVFFSIGGLDIYDENGELIPFTEADVYCNADHNAMGGDDGGGMPALLDGNRDTHFHSTWSYSVSENHYIEFTFPEGEYTAFSFKLTCRKDHEYQCPAKIDIRYVSDLLTDLRSLVGQAESILPARGTTVGCFNLDLGEFNAALARAKELANADFASDTDVRAALNELTLAIATLQENFVLPEAGKSYRIISGEDGFLPLQKVQKAFTIHEDEEYGKWLWWEDASADHAEQAFSFEPMPEMGENYYAIKNTKYDLYLGDFYNEDGSKVDNKFVLTEEPTPFFFKYLGQGQFAILRSGSWLHLYDHNQGTPDYNATTQEGREEAIKGVTSSVITWGGGLNDPSSYMIQELQTLPFNAKSISDINFKSEDIHMYKGYNVFTLTADKECAFSDLTIYGRLGQKVNAGISVSGNVATVKLDTAAVASISFEFTNNEKVSEVKFDASLVAFSNVSYLQDAYDEAVAVAPVEGNNVGQVSDLSAYYAALEAAEALIEMGGSEAELKEAEDALDAAVAGLVYNLPKADKEYYIICALDFKKNHYTDMAICHRDTELYWTYVNVNKPIYRWKFIDCGQQISGTSAYYVQNVESGKYISQYVSNAGRLSVVDTPEATQPYNIYNLKSGKVCVSDARSNVGAYSLHPLSHSSGSGTHGGVISYNSSDAASAMYVVEADEYYKQYFDGIEDIEFVGDQVAPAVKGTFDLFGRRIDTPAATGIYIVDGKKVVIKK